MCVQWNSVNIIEFVNKKVFFDLLTFCSQGICKGIFISQPRRVAYYQSESRKKHVMSQECQILISRSARVCRLIIGSVYKKSWKKQNRKITGNIKRIELQRKWRNKIEKFSKIWEQWKKNKLFWTKPNPVF